MEFDLQATCTYGSTHYNEFGGLDPPPPPPPPPMILATERQEIKKFDMCKVDLYENSVKSCTRQKKLVTKAQNYCAKTSGGPPPPPGLIRVK